MYERPLTENMRTDIREYEKTGGYSALKKVAGKLEPSKVIEIVKASELRGRGGAGFQTGLKWSFVPHGDKAPGLKYFIVNADEMEPGTFKDRVLIEEAPHQVIEGAIISSYAIQAGIAFIFLRLEYVKGSRILAKAIEEAKKAGYLGDNILKSGYSLQLFLHASAGRYMCGEETGLLNALEGKRANPRSKPPFPQVSGLWGEPTAVNNVETVANIPHIINKGAEWFKGLGKGDAGTKLFGVSGKVKNPGLWELPMGTTFRELIMEHAGGMREGIFLRGFLPGGASTDFLLEEHLDTPMNFESVAKKGSRFGTGTAIILDDKTCPVGFVNNLENFFSRESCGWCTPCREGIPWIQRILKSIEHGKGREDDFELLEHLQKMIAPGKTYCAFAPGAAEPLQSALKYFREDFERHIKEKRCPYSG